MNMKELTIAFSARNGRVEMELLDGRRATAVREMAGKPWKINDPWGTWSMMGTRGDVVCDMKRRITVFLDNENCVRP